MRTTRYWASAASPGLGGGLAWLVSAPPLPNSRTGKPEVDSRLLISYRPAVTWSVPAPSQALFSSSSPTLLHSSPTSTLPVVPRGLKIQLMLHVACVIVSIVLCSRCHSCLTFSLYVALYTSHSLISLLQNSPCLQPSHPVPQACPPQLPSALSRHSGPQ